MSQMSMKRASINIFIFISRVRWCGRVDTATGVTRKIGRKIITVGRLGNENIYRIKVQVEKIKGTKVTILKSLIKKR